MDPEDLIPKLPKPQDLKPFPTVQALVRFWRGVGEGPRRLARGFC